jgi:hypothetical protein
VEPLSVGKVIVATWRPHETIALELIRDLGLELQVIFNKGAVMVLPSGVNKAFGLSAALRELKLSPHNTLGVGDAENDHAFLTLCECSVAVANALPTLKEQVDFTTAQDHGAGVAELINELVESDLESREAALHRPRIALGCRVDGAELTVAPLSENLLIAGPSGSGKSRLAKSMLESLSDRGYQFCIVDPEGDYEGIENAVTLGDTDREPNIDEVMSILDLPEQNLVVNLLNVPVDKRPEFLERFLDRLQKLYQAAGRPHRLILDEAHHLVPAAWETERALTEYCQATLLITVHPEHVSKFALSPVHDIVAIGKNPQEPIRAFAAATGENAPEIPTEAAAEAWFWKKSEKDVHPFRIAQARSEHRRHKRKYAEGVLGDDKCFYFTGPDAKLRLKAQNLMQFLQLADGVDEETWTFHLRRGDYSRWFRDCIKNQSLAAEAERIESRPEASAAESRALVRQEIEARYTAPA